LKEKEEIHDLELSYKCKIIHKKALSKLTSSKGDKMPKLFNKTKYINKHKGAPL